MSESTLTVRPLLCAEHRETVAAQLRRARQQEVQRRVREADATLWGPAGAPEIANRLGWLTIAARMQDQLQDLRAFADALSAEGIEQVLLMGMGGSSLAPEVFRRAFDLNGPGPAAAGAARLRVLDSTSSAAIRAADAALTPEKTLFLVSSKSGGTLEPLSMLAHFWQRAGQDSSRFAAITDAGSALEQLAAERSFRRVFHGDPDIGGRYSALSPFGVVPAALAGVDVQSLLTRSRQAWDTPVDGEDELPAWLWLGAALSALAQAGADKLTFIVPHSLDGLGLWLEQLFAESTGKQGTGILPVAQEPLCDPAAYGRDRVFVHISDLSAPEPAAAQAATATRALADAGHPVIELPTEGPPDLGRVFMLAELCVAVAGWGLTINPFDQPNVQEAKDATNRVLTSPGQSATPEASIEQVREMLAQASPPAYVALMGYLAPSADFDEAIAQLRRRIVEATSATTTFGYGPRFLHSTGQFHKGGPPVGRFLQLVHDGGEAVPVPGKPYTFTQLMHAQADGDFQTLRAHGLPVARVSLRGEDPAAALRSLGEQLLR